MRRDGFTVRAKPHGIGGTIHSTRRWHLKTSRPLRWAFLLWTAGTQRTYKMEEKMAAHFFEGLDGIDRHGKPRVKGLTMVIDWGMGMCAQHDVVETGEEYIDLAKIAVGISRLFPNERLVEKIKHYQDHGVEPFPGGQYLEYAELCGKAEVYFPAVVEAGYRWVEVSDNVLAVSAEWKERMIRQAVEEYGLSVLGEVGKKEGLENPIPLVDNAKVCVDSGSRIVLVEAAELVSGDAETVREVEQVVEEVGLDRVMFELPGPWIADVCAHHIHRMRRDLIDRYGRDVNIGNVDFHDLMSMEAYRRDLGVNAGKMLT